MALRNSSFNKIHCSVPESTKDKETITQQLTVLHTQILSVIAAFESADIEFNDSITALDLAYKEADEVLRAEVVSRSSTDVGVLSNQVNLMDTTYKAEDVLIRSEIANEVENLNTIITALDAAYKLADIGLNQSITNLDSTIESAIIDLNLTIAETITAYQNADTTIIGLINTEEVLRENADNFLSTRIDDLELNYDDEFLTTNGLITAIDAAYKSADIDINSIITQLINTVNLIDIDVTGTENSIISVNEELEDVQNTLGQVNTDLSVNIPNEILRLDAARDVVKSTAFNLGESYESILSFVAAAAVNAGKDVDRTYGIRSEFTATSEALSILQTDVLQKADSFTVTAIRAELKGDIAGLVLGDESAAINAVLGDLEGRIDAAELKVTPEAITSSVDAVVLEQDLASISDVTLAITALSISSYLQTATFTPYITKIETAEETLQSNLYKRSLTSFSIADDASSSLAERLLAVTALSFLEAGKGTDLKGALAATDKNIVVLTDATSASTEETNSHLSILDNSIASAFQSIQTLSDTDQNTAVAFEQYKVDSLIPSSEGGTGVVAVAEEFTRATVGYCVISDAISAHVDKASCELAGGTWDQLPLAEAQSKVSLTLTRPNGDTVSGNAGSLFQVLTSDVGSLIGRSYLGVDVNNRPVGLVVTDINGQETSGTIDLIGDIVRFLKPSTLDPFVTFDTNNNTATFDGVIKLTDGTTIGTVTDIEGADGKSAYELWLDEGNTGTETDFFNSLEGPQGQGATVNRVGTNTIVEGINGSVTIPDGVTPVITTNVSDPDNVVITINGTDTTFPKGTVLTLGVDYVDGLNGDYISHVFRLEAEGVTPAKPTNGSYNPASNPEELLPTEPDIWSDDRMDITSGFVRWISSTRYQETKTYTNGVADTPTWARKNSTWSVPAIDALQGVKGDSAKTLVVTSDSQTFSYDKDGVLFGNASITITANVQNLGGSTSWATVPVDIGTANEDEYTISSTQFAANTSVKVTASRDGLSDTTTIVRLSDGAVGEEGADGSSAITVVLSNQNHFIPSASDGSTTATDRLNSGTEIRVYEGTELLTYDSSRTYSNVNVLNHSKWKMVSAVVENVVKGALNGVDGEDHAAYEDITDISAEKGSITFTVTGQTSTGVQFTSSPTAQIFTRNKLAKSAYQIWQEEGGVGSEADFLAELNGEPGSATHYLTLRDGVFPSDTLASADFVTAYGRSPILDDILVYRNADHTVLSLKRFDGTDWITTGAFFPGDVIALGTISGDRLVAGTEIAAPLIKGGQFEYIGSTHMGVVTATPVGSTNQFIEWFGPKLLNGTNMDYSSMTEDNGIFYKKSDGTGFMNNQFIAGQITENQFATASTSANIVPTASLTHTTIGNSVDITYSASEGGLITGNYEGIGLEIEVKIKRDGVLIHTDYFSGQGQAYEPEIAKTKIRINGSGFFSDTTTVGDKVYSIEMTTFNDSTSNRAVSIKTFENLVG